jgi:hypothetical protein
MLWPMPKFEEGDEPHFLFILTPPNSGSTAFVQLLNTSCRTMLLQPRGEGQWLIPGLCQSDRWNPNKDVNYRSVQAVWLSRFQAIKRLVNNVDVVIEKSPPNMMRINEISSNFKSYSLLAINRDPYASIASSLFRWYDVENMNDDERISALTYLGDTWIKRSKTIREHILGINIQMITYEEFCNDPYAAMNKIQIPEGVLDSVNANAEVKVRDYKPQKIINQNIRQISTLKDNEISHVTKILNGENDLLSFYGYRTITN